MTGKPSLLPDPRQLLRDSGLVLTLTLVAFAADFALNIGLSRGLTPENFGDYAVGLVALTVGMNVAMLGAEQSVTRFLPEYLHRHDMHALPLLAATAVGGNVVANALLIRVYGTAGAAATSLATYGAYSVAATVFAVYRLDLLPWRRPDPPA